MSAKSAKSCIRTNDYEEAVSRYEKANKEWRVHWWDCILKIYEKCQEFAQKYVLDPVKKEVVKRIKKVCAKTENLSNTYFIKIFDNNGKWIYNKIGKGNNLTKRLKEQVGHIYKDGGVFKDYEIIRYYVLPNDDLALVLESFMRNHFRKKYSYIPNDRFYAFEPDEEDFNIFETYYNLVVNNA